MRNKKLIIIFSVVCVLTLLVVLNSVVFSVQHIDAYCYNADDRELETTVVSNAGLKKGKSIFTVKEDKVISAVEHNVSNVRVRNIERKFPNRVCINYVKIFPYLELHRDGKYYVCGNDARIMQIGDAAANAETIIELKSDAPLSDAQIGDYLFREGDDDLRIVTEILSTLERFGYHQNMVEMIRLIDIRKAGYAYIRMESGVTVKMIGTDGIFDKLWYAMSIYVNTDDAHKNSGTIVVTGGTNTYTPENLYETEMGNYQ